MTCLPSNKLKKLTCKAGHASRIIKPLEQVEITGVFYERIYHDGTSINIANDKSWTKFYFEKIAGMEYQKVHVAEHCLLKPGISLSASLPKNQLWLDAKYYFGHGNGITIIEDHCHYREIIGFYSTSKNTKINNYYMNHLDQIKLLKKYFVIEAAEQITELENERIISSYGPYICSNEPHETKFCIDNKTNIQATNLLPSLIDKDLLIMNKKTRIPIHLSPQRIKCLTLLARGYSTKQIAHEMQLAPKTIEHYLAILRKQLSCKSSKELIALYGDQIYNDK